MNPNQMSYAFVMGVLLAVTVINTDNLVCGMILHFLFNFYNLLEWLPGLPVQGRIRELINKAQSLLQPPILSKGGVLMPGNLFTGFLTALLSTLLYLIILKNMCKKS